MAGSFHLAGNTTLQLSAEASFGTINNISRWAQKLLKKFRVGVVNLTRINFSHNIPLFLKRDVVGNIVDTADAIVHS